MRHCKLVALFLSLALFPRSPAAAQASDAKPDLGANAALNYWTAFALLPTLDKDQEKLLDQWNKVPLDAAARSLIDRSRESREYLRRGATFKHCDWSLDYSQGIRLVMPHLAKSRVLAPLAALDARYEFEQGHWKAGAEDVAALLKLARHLETEPMMIQQLVAYGIERTAIEAAAPYLPELKSVLPEIASDVLDSPPAGATLKEMVQKEKQIGPIWLMQELKNAEKRKPGSWQEVWKGLFPAPESSEADFLLPPESFEQTIKLLQDLVPLFDELANMTTLPWAEFDAQYTQFVKKGKSANRLFGLLVPAVGNFVAAQRRHPAQLVLFKAALAVVQSGPDKLKEIKDPFGDGPFEYRALDKGFELKSKLLFKGQSVTLMVGNAKKG